jgi:prolyl-tRNA synthetase
MATCSSCDYAAALDAANFARRDANYGEPAELEKVETPDCHTIADLCAFLDIDPAQTLKLVIYTINFNQPDEAVVMAVIRGDLDVSETKLKRVLGVDHIEPTTEDMIVETGAVAGYASPIGLKVRQEDDESGVLVIADESLRQMTNFVTGANEAEYHYINANAPRDFDVTRYADIAQPYEGAACPSCGGSLHIEPAVELGTAFQVGEAAGATFLPASGDALPLLLAEYHLYLDRLIAAVIEAHHDDYGILWPHVLAPYDVHLVAIGKSTDEEAIGVAGQLYLDLQVAGLSVLYDDRLQSPGVMFNDADLMGVPLRLTVGARSLENGGVEVKWRSEKDRDILPLEGLVEAVCGMVQA